MLLMSGDATYISKHIVVVMEESLWITLWRLDEKLTLGHILICSDPACCYSISAM